MSDIFIGIYEKAFSKDYCERAIKYFDSMHKQGCTRNRMQTDNAKKTIKDDYAIYSHDEINLQNTEDLLLIFNETFWKIYVEQYAPNFGVLAEAGRHNNYSFKMQKTVIGGGFHTWHFEADVRGNCHRLLTWMVYLNDVAEGGETEFLYQHIRIKPTQGTLLIWPASFTHTHRGNPPLSNDKYVITGWTEF